MSKITEYDKSKLFEEEVRPLLTKIESICKANALPFFFTAATVSTEQGTTYENSASTALPMGIFLRNDQLVEHVKVAAGFETTAPDRIPDVELD